MKMHFGQDEVISFLEERVKDNVASEKEFDFYLDLRWNQVFDKELHLHTYKQVLKKMKRLYIK